ncbi:MAG: DUF2141 domain-containing protein [Cyanobacteria bacterium J06629_18]
MKAKLKAVSLLVAALVNITILPKTDAAFRGNLSVRVDGLKNKKGQVCLNIFAASKGFPNNSQRAVKSGCIKASKNPTIVTFSSLKAGNYAVAVIHDENGDNNLNRNAFSIPTEGFGFSNNPIIRTGPPKFNESAILVAGSNINIKVNLQYLFGN